MINIILSVNPNRPRRLYYLLLPLFFGLVGSAILHYELKSDKVRYSDINYVNWLVGIITTVGAVVISLILVPLYPY